MDSVLVQIDGTANIFPDSTITNHNDSIKKDTLNLSKDAVKSKVIYSALDSIRFDISNKKVYLFGNAEVKYESITLKSAYIQIDWTDNSIYAEGKTDSLGKLIGKPEFAEGSESFHANTLKYNFTTKKGKINDIIAKEGESYIHGEQVKKLDNDDLFIKTGKYTTCDQEHPHFEIHAEKLKIIKDDKIVTGPAYLAVADVPTPLALPFGFFPNQKGQTSGILLPAYGYSESQGYYLSKGGYYWGINDYFDYTATADAYSMGSWQLDNSFNYKKRYRYIGSFNLANAILKYGEPTDPDFEKKSSFIVKWSHSQDTKAKPNSQFSASVKFGTSNHYQNNLQNTTEYLDNNYTSNISYTRSFQWFNITTSASHNQNTGTHAIDITLPEFNIASTKDIYLFKWGKKQSPNKLISKFQEISLRYTINSKNQISTIDTLLFNDSLTYRLGNIFNYISSPENDPERGIDPQLLSDNSSSKFKNGIKINPSIQLPTFNVFKYLRLKSGLSYVGRTYFQQLNKYFEDDSLITDTLSGTYYVHNYGFTSSLSTTIYGTKIFKNEVVKGIRHTITPALSFNYNPSFGTDNNQVDYYGTYTDTSNEEQVFSRYQDFIYGNAPQAKSGKVGFSLGNRLELKIRSKNDSVPSYVNHPLIGGLSLSTAYDLAKDSLNLDPITLSANTSLFKNKVQLSYSASWDPYIKDTNGVRLNQFEWNVNNRPARFTSSSSTFSLGFNLSPPGSENKEDKTSDKGVEEELNDINQNPDAYVDFSIPWELNVSYNYRMGITRQNDGSFDTSTTHTVNLKGEISLTPKWKVSFVTGYDIKNKEATPTNITIYRDLHCWEMSFYIVPFGTYKSYEFKINVKATVLQDLKLNRKRIWFDQ
jgi:hypothetical protein